MSSPSVYRQLPGAIQVNGKKLQSSPRHWNAGILLYKDRLWLAYRYHRKSTDTRSAIGIVELSQKTYQPLGKPQTVDLDSLTGTEHHEDPRLFMYRGQPYISYTEMQGYRPGIDYNCVIKYARLNLKEERWSVEQTWHPNYRSNTGYGKEKNWVFFESQDRLYCIYESSPRQTVLEIHDGVVLDEYQTEAPVWPWGIIRGGAPPLLMPDTGEFLHVFHSSLPTEVAPHFVRYYAGAYTFGAKPPFTPRMITVRPLVVASEEDGHQIDPRYVEGWKPFVVFPCGALMVDGQILMSMGVNDWHICISRLPAKSAFTPADGQSVPARYFTTGNGSRPEEVLSVGTNRRTDYIRWEVPTPGRHGSAGIGYLQVRDQRVAEELSIRRHIREIDLKAYLQATEIGARR